jgi:hypothetical protein
MKCELGRYESLPWDTGIGRNPARKSLRADNTNAKCQESNLGVSDRMQLYL